MARAYKIRVAGRSNGVATYELGVPAHIAKQVPENVRFLPQVTKQGILYVAIREGDPMPVSDDRPEWMQEASYRMPGPGDG